MKELFFLFAIKRVREEKPRGLQQTSLFYPHRGKPVEETLFFEAGA